MANTRTPATHENLAAAIAELSPDARELMHTLMYVWAWGADGWTGGEYGDSAREIQRAVERVTGLTLPLPTHS